MPVARHVCASGGCAPGFLTNAVRPTIVVSKRQVNRGVLGGNCDASRRFDAMRGGAHGLVVACGVDSSRNVTGVYVREFGQCYSWRTRIGAGQCAVVVNTTNAAVSIGGSRTSPWKYPSGKAALSQSYNDMLILSGNDMVTDGCSTVTGCRTGAGTDLNFGGPCTPFSTQVAPSDAAYLFHT